MRHASRNDLQKITFPCFSSLALLTSTLTSMNIIQLYHHATSQCIFLSHLHGAGSQCRNILVPPKKYHEATHESFYASATNLSDRTVLPHRPEQSWRSLQPEASWVVHLDCKKPVRALPLEETSGSKAWSFQGQSPVDLEKRDIRLTTAEPCNPLEN